MLEKRIIKIAGPREREDRYAILRPIFSRRPSFPSWLDVAQGFPGHLLGSQYISAWPLGGGAARGGGWGGWGGGVVVGLFGGGVMGSFVELLVLLPQRTCTLQLGRPPLIFKHVLESSVWYIP